MCEKPYDLESQIKDYPGTIVKVKKLIIHPYYTDPKMNAYYTAPADFCLAKVEKMNFFSSKFIRPIKIATEELRQRQYCEVLKFVQSNYFILLFRGLIYFCKSLVSERYCAFEQCSLDRLALKIKSFLSWISHQPMTVSDFF